MKKRMEEGLIDQNTFSQSSTQLMAKTTEGICGVFNQNLSVGDPERYESYSVCRPKYDENSEKIGADDRGLAVFKQPGGGTNNAAIRICFTGNAPWRGYSGCTATAVKFQ